MSAGEQDLIKAFDELGIAHELYRHPPFFTVADGEDFKEQHPGGHGKCLFLKDKDGARVLAAVSQERRADLKRLAKDIGVGRLSFCRPEEVETVLGVRPGAVTPLAVMNLAAGEGGSALQVAVDAALTKEAKVFFHPLHNEATVAIAPADLLRFIRRFGFDPEVVDLG